MSSGGGQCTPHKCGKVEKARLVLQTYNEVHFTSQYPYGFKLLGSDVNTLWGHSCLKRLFIDFFDKKCHILLHKTLETQ